MIENTSQENIDTADLRSDIPQAYHFNIKHVTFSLITFNRIR